MTTHAPNAKLQILKIVALAFSQESLIQKPTHVIALTDILMTPQKQLALNVIIPVISVQLQM